MVATIALEVAWWMLAPSVRCPRAPYYLRLASNDDLPFSPRLALVRAVN